jgi:hypothetical protein
LSTYIAAIDHTRRNFDLACAYSMNAMVKARKNCGFSGTVREEMNRMHSPRLSEPVDPADALFQPNGVPWELEVYDEAAARLQVQSLGPGIGGKQKV